MTPDTCTDYIKRHTEIISLESPHFMAKMMNDGYYRISIKESRYLFCWPEDLDELIGLLEAAKKEVGK